MADINDRLQRACVSLLYDEWRGYITPEMKRQRIDKLDAEYNERDVDRALEIVRTTIDACFINMYPDLAIN